MVKRNDSRAEFEEPAHPFDAMTDAEIRALSDEERDRIDEEWVERFEEWSHRFQREAMEEIRELQRTRGIFGISTSV